MNKILYGTCKEEQEDYKKKIDAFLSQLPESMRPQARKAFDYQQRGEYAEVIGICQGLEEAGELLPELEMMLGQAYLSNGQVLLAEARFRKLMDKYPKEEYPRISLGISLHASGKYKDAAGVFGTVYPPSEYEPFFYTSYADSLQHIGRQKESRKIFREFIDIYETDHFNPSSELIDGDFQNLLYLDVCLANGEFERDQQSYFQFLSRVEMTDVMQEHLASTVVYLAALNIKKWFRPLFLKFIGEIGRRGYLKLESLHDVLESGYCSVESFKYHEDGRINAFLESLMSSLHDMVFMLQDNLSQMESDSIKVNALTYEWYACQYFPGHKEAFQYIQTAYPHIWRNMEGVIKKIEEDAEGEAHSRSRQLLRYTPNTTLDDLERDLQRAYIRAINASKEPVYIHDGSQPGRVGTKIDRNAPCPCGSGKKYKKCCGR